MTTSIAVVGSALAALVSCGGSAPGSTDAAALPPTRPSTQTTVQQPTGDLPSPVDCLATKAKNVIESRDGELRFFSIEYGPELNNSWISVEFYRSAGEAQSELVPGCFRPGAPERCLGGTLARYRWRHIIVDWEYPPEFTISLVESCFGRPPDRKW
jgi:hypothetical protein